MEALVDGACDREALARDAIFKSLEDIGRRKFSTVLEIAHGYLTKHNKVGRQSRHQLHLMIMNFFFSKAWPSTSYHSSYIDGEDK